MNTENIKLLEKFTTFCAVKNKTISNNIANIGSEGYKRQDISFKDLLSDSLNSNLRTTTTKHIAHSPQPQTFGNIITDNSTDSISGINNVNIDNEMADLATNTILFRFSTKKISGYYKNLQNVIKGGGKF